MLCCLMRYVMMEIQITEMDAILIVRYRMDISVYQLNQVNAYLN